LLFENAGLHAGATLLRVTTQHSAPAANFTDRLLLLRQTAKQHRNKRFKSIDFL